jgi:DNA-directed RNA polymerase specialized sigma24 family protein
MAQRPPEGAPTGERAFGEIVQRYSRMLTAFLCHYLGNVEHARDLVQETFLDAWRAAQAGRDPFASGDDVGTRRWLYHAAYNKANSVLRRQKLIRWESLTPLLDAESLSRSRIALRKPRSCGQHWRSCRKPISRACCCVSLRASSTPRSPRSWMPRPMR